MITTTKKSGENEQLAIDILVSPHFLPPYTLRNNNELTVFHERIKGKLNRDARIKDDDFSGCSEYREAIVRFQKVPHSLSSRTPYHNHFILQLHWQLHWWFRVHSAVSFRENAEPLSRVFSTTTAIRKLPSSQSDSFPALIMLNDSGFNNTFSCPVFKSQLDLVSFCYVQD
jgi:hypothetical protein